MSDILKKLMPAWIPALIFVLMGLGWLGTYLVLDHKLDTASTTIGNLNKIYYELKSNYQVCQSNNANLSAVIDVQNARIIQNGLDYKKQLAERDQKLATIDAQNTANSKKLREVTKAFSESRATCKESMEWLKSQSQSLRW